MILYVECPYTVRLYIVAFMPEQFVNKPYQNKKSKQNNTFKRKRKESFEKLLNVSKSTYQVLESSTTSG